MGNKINKPKKLKPFSANYSNSSPNGRCIQNFLVIWLDGNIDTVKNEDCLNTISKLREVANNVNTFTDVNKCIDFIKSIEDEKTFVISSGTFGQNAVPIIHEMSQVNTIYIFCTNQARHEQWARDWSKVKGVFTEISPICEALKTGVQQCDQNLLLISFVPPVKKTTNESADELDQSFMYTQILKEILLTIDFEQKHIDAFVKDCKEQFIGNNKELENVKKLKREYRKHVPIWWYTYPSFLYSMLNRALRLMDVDLIISMGFFIRELHQDIATRHIGQYGGHDQIASFTVYRGQGLSKTDFDKLIKMNGGLLSFNNFLSTSKTRQVSLNFAQEALQTTDLVGVLFIMKIDPSIKSTPFANVSNISYFQKEDEILFSMHAIFRIGEIKTVAGNSRLWEVSLTLTTDNDTQLRLLTECIREETFPHLKGWYRLGCLLYKMGDFEHAQQVFDIMLDQSTDIRENATIHHSLGLAKYAQGKYSEAIQAYQTAIEIHQAHCFNSQDAASSYSGMGVVYDSMGEHSKALSLHEKALGILQKILPPSHPDLATSYNNIGLVYSKMSDYSKALSSHEKALGILQKTLPPNHPDLATSYNNIGLVYSKLGDYSKALSSYEKALEIKKKALPSNHPCLATAYKNIGEVYVKMGEYARALSSHEKGLEVLQRALSPNPLDLINSYSSHGSLFSKMGEYSKALSSYEKAIEILQKNLPSNHSDLATSYYNIAQVYYKVNNYSKSLRFFECALNIKQRILPADDLDLQNTKQWTETVKKKL